MVKTVRMVIVMQGSVGCMPQGVKEIVVHSQVGGSVVEVGVTVVLPLKVVSLTTCGEVKSDFGPRDPTVVSGLLEVLVSLFPSNYPTSARSMPSLGFLEGVSGDFSQLIRV